MVNVIAGYTFQQIVLAQPALFHLAHTKPYSHKSCQKFKHDTLTKIQTRVLRLRFLINNVSLVLTAKNSCKIRLRTPVALLQGQMGRERDEMCANLVRESAHKDTIASQLTHVDTTELPHLSCYAVFFHQRLLTHTCQSHVSTSHTLHN